jgi:hypothetical protein
METHLAKYFLQGKYCINQETNICLALITQSRSMLSNHTCYVHQIYMAVKASQQGKSTRQVLREYVACSPRTLMMKSSSRISRDYISPKERLEQPNQISDTQLYF